MTILHSSKSAGQYAKRNIAEEIETGLKEMIALIRAEPPRVYLQPHTGLTPPVLCVGGTRYVLTPERALVWIQQLASYLNSPALVDVKDLSDV